MIFCKRPGWTPVAACGVFRVLESLTPLTSGTGSGLDGMRPDLGGTPGNAAVLASGWNSEMIITTIQVSSRNGRLSA